MISLGTGLRSAAPLAATAALNIGCWSWCGADRATLPAALGPAGRPDLPMLLAGLAAVLLQAALAWLLLLAVLVALEPLSGRDLTSYAGCPASLRRVLVACCGAAALGALATPAHADPTPPHGDRPHGVVLDGLPLPDRTLGALDERVPPGRHVVVRRGDTLWGIAAAHLPASSTTDDVDRAWRALYADNRSQIGADPDLITPGTRLRLPPTPHQEDDR
jgi:hypothetical protein